MDFSVCKQRLKCWLCVFLFSRQNGAERKQRPIFTFFLPPFSNHSARHRLPLLGYPLSGKSTRQLSNYKRKNYWLCKLSIYFSNAHFHMLLMLVVSMLASSIPLPFIFKLGVEKGRTAYYVMIGFVCGASVLATSFFRSQLGIEIKPNLVLAILAVVGVGVYALSWRMAITFYKKREIQ